MKPRPWDALDIETLIDSALEGFAGHFYGRTFARLHVRSRKAILREIARHARAIAKAECGELAGTVNSDSPDSEKGEGGAK